MRWVWRGLLVFSVLLSGAMSHGDARFWMVYEIVLLLYLAAAYALWRALKWAAQWAFLRLPAVRTVFRRAPAVEPPTFGCKACPFTTADVWAAEQHTWGTGHLVDTISGLGEQEGGHEQGGVARPHR